MWALVLVSLLTMRTAQAAIHVELVSSSTLVTTGQEFEVTLSLPTSGSSFNAMDFVLVYDPQSLALLPATPSKSQEGCLMTGGCSTACGNSFHQFQAAGDSVFVTDVLLCNKVAVSGPGDLYRLRFRALAGRSPQATIALRRVRFSNAGLFVPEVTSSEVRILDPALLDVGGVPRNAASLRAEPNPSRGRVQWVLSGATGGLTRIEVLDAQGRVVRRLAPVWTTASARVEWDGLDDAGHSTADGVYLARITRGGVTHTSRIVRVR